MKKTGYSMIILGIVMLAVGGAVKLATIMYLGPVVSLLGLIFLSARRRRSEVLQF